MNIHEFTVLIEGAQGRTYRILPLEESLASLGFVPRVGDLLVASPDGEPVPGLDEDDAPVLLELELVEVASIIIDPHAQLAIVMVSDPHAPDVPPPPPQKKSHKKA